VREDHGRRDGVEVLAHRFSRAARVGGVAQALEVGPLLGGTVSSSMLLGGRAVSSWRTRIR
jgi:hypothetical protein